MKTGRFPPTDSRLLAQLQKFREEADDNETFVADAASTIEDLAAAGRLVDRLAAALPTRYADRFATARRSLPRPA